MNFSRNIVVFVIIGLFIGTGIIPGIQNDISDSSIACSKEIIASNQEDNFDLLIIAPFEYNDALNILINHKNRYGVKTRIVNLEQIIINDCRDKQEEIKWFIKESIENHHISYVLLVGDREKIPVRYSYAGEVENLQPFISDLYYADIYNETGEFCTWDTNNNNKFGELNKNEMIDKLDLYPDVYIGRLLCSNTLEVTTVVQKIINYEENTYEEEWFNNIILCGGDTFCSILLKLLNLIRETKGFEGEIVCNEVKHLLNDFNPIMLYASVILSPLLSKKSSNITFLTYENINKAINNGAGFVLFSGHGTPEAWMTNTPIFQNLLSFLTCYQSIFINELTNEEKLPIIVMDACSCGDFSETTGVSSPISWNFVKQQNGGAIASIASTTVSFCGIGESAKLQTSGYFTTLLFNATTLGYTGNMLAEAQTNFLNSFPYDNKDCLIVEEFMLFGDPSLKIGGYP